MKNLFPILQAIIFSIVCLPDVQAGLVENPLGNYKFSSGDYREILSVKLPHSLTEAEVEKISEASFTPFVEGAETEEITLIETERRGKNSLDHFWYDHRNNFLHMHISFHDRGPGAYSYMGGKYVISVGTRELFLGEQTDIAAVTWEAVMFAPVVRVAGQERQNAVVVPASQESLALNIYLNYGSATVTLNEEGPLYQTYHDALLELYPTPGVANGSRYGPNTETGAYVYEYDNSDTPLIGTIYAVPVADYIAFGESFPHDSSTSVLDGANVVSFDLDSLPHIDRLQPGHEICPVYQYHWTQSIDLSQLNGAGDYVFVVSITAPQAAGNKALEQMQDLSTDLRTLIAWDPLGGASTPNRAVHQTAGGIRIRLDADAAETYAVSPEEIPISTGPNISDDGDLLPDGWEERVYATEKYTDGTYDDNGDHAHDIVDFLTGLTLNFENAVRIVIDSDYGTVSFNQKPVLGGWFPKDTVGLKWYLSHKATEAPFPSGYGKLDFFAMSVTSSRNEGVPLPGSSATVAQYQNAKGSVGSGEEHPWKGELLEFEVAADQSERFAVTWGEAANGSLETDTDGDSVPDYLDPFSQGTLTGGGQTQPGDVNKALNITITIPSASAQ